MAMGDEIDVVVDHAGYRPLLRPSQHQDRRRLRLIPGAARSRLHACGGQKRATPYAAGDRRTIRKAKRPVASRCWPCIQGSPSQSWSWGKPKGRRLMLTGQDLSHSRGALVADDTTVTIPGHDGGAVLEFTRDLAGLYFPAITIPLSEPEPQSAPNDLTSIP